MGTGTNREETGKKKEGLWKLAPLKENRKERGFPQRLEKSLANDARLFHSSHRPDGGDQLRLTSRVGPNETIKRGQIKLTEPVLTQTLRHMERDGLLTRTVHPVVPPKVEYKLAQLGLSLSASFVAYGFGQRKTSIWSRSPR